MQMQKKLELLLEEAGAKLAFASHTFEEAEPLMEYHTGWAADAGDAGDAGNAGEAGQTLLPAGEAAAWEITLGCAGIGGSSDGARLEVNWFHRGQSLQTAAEVRFEFAAWDRTNYVLVPGAIYNGNRFDVRSFSYPPCWSKLPEHGPDTPALITDVPRLSVGPGPSAFHLLAGDAATPAVGVYDPVRRQGILILTCQQTGCGETSIHVQEAEDRGSAVISFRAPGVRPRIKYDMCTTGAPSPDRGADFGEGDKLSLSFEVYSFPCGSVDGLFARFAGVRKSLAGIQALSSSLPFSAAWAIQEQKYTELNWKEPYGYYAVGTVDMKHQDWQLGWVGGGMSSYALLLAGGEESVRRAGRTLDFIFGGQTEAGFFPGVFYNGRYYGDEFNEDPQRDHPEQWHIVRKSADALYFLVKHLMAMNTLHPNEPVPERWIEGTRRLADGFLRLWGRYGQFGQWVQAETGELLVGGSAGGAMAVAGLALFGQHLNEEVYLAAARAAGDYYYRQYTREGVTTGGPGEILQCPDSESAFALLEAFIVLHETTGEEKWLQRAEEAARQAISWCVSYNFVFPQESTFGRLGIETAGSVIANVQNKHSAPGICTLSGDSLLKLFRATGNPLYMEQLRDTAHQLPQYLSRQDRPIMGWDGKELLPGYMSERVNMSDWEGTELIGEVLPLSCWCEVSNMLTYAEVPGIYVQPDTGLLWIFDHVECSLEQEEGRLVLTVANTTNYPAEVSIFAELSTAAGVPLGQCASADWPRITLEPGAVRRVPLAFH